MPVFNFQLDRFDIENTRARHTDTDHVAVGLQVDGAQYPTQTRNMGDLNNGTYDVMMGFNNVIVSLNSTPVIFNWQIINNGHASDQSIDNALVGTASKLASTAATDLGNDVLPGTGSIWGAVAGSIVGWLGGIVFADCDGPVAVDQIVLNGATVVARTSNGGYSERRFYPGIDSATGCGSNSQYHAAFSISAAAMQDGWSWCSKCEGMHFSAAGNPGRCPAGGGHVTGGSGNYAFANNDPQAPGQAGWSWCSKCQGMHFLNAQGVLGPCPAGGKHSTAGSGAYKVVLNDPQARGQGNWSWCLKCGGLHYTGGLAAGTTTGPGAGACPGGGVHTSDPSGVYTVLMAGT
jgi:hypothetical protein